MRHSSGLLWDEETGIGYYPVDESAQVYGRAYWGRYRAMSETPMGRALTGARVELVRQYAPGALVDIGIGSGQFVGALPGTRGYDVMPQAVAWLKGKRLWCDPYEEALEAITCWDSLEHIALPGVLVGRVFGTVFVSIPIFTDLAHVLGSRHFRKDEHFWYFTDRGLRDWFHRRGFLCVGHNTMETDLGREDIGTYIFRRRIG